MGDWYPSDKKELANLLEKFLRADSKVYKKKITGIIVPHAGYAYSGDVAGKAYSFLKNTRHKKAIVLAPSHYFPLIGAVSHSESEWISPLGKIKVNQNGFEKNNISQEHAIDNQVPFLLKLGFKEIIPIVVGEIDSDKAREIAEKIMNIKDAVLVISTDLSHFLPYDEAVKKDKSTIHAIEFLEAGGLNENSACGIFPLLVLIELCKIKRLKPELIEYKNSGDITGDKSSVVGYSSFVF